MELLSTDLVYIHSPGVKQSLTKMGVYPVDFSEFSIDIFRDILTGNEPNITLPYYRVASVLKILANKQLQSINFIMALEEVPFVQIEQGMLW